VFAGKKRMGAGRAEENSGICLFIFDSFSLFIHLFFCCFLCYFIIFVNFLFFMFFDFFLVFSPFMPERLCHVI